jgi:hypothetical protein
MVSSRGCFGVLEVNGESLSEVRGWNITNKEQKFIGSINCIQNKTDTAGQGALVVGIAVELTVYPDGRVQGKEFTKFTAVITSKKLSARYDGYIEVSFGFKTASLIWEVVE